jgi:hypothetical protein
LSDANFRLAWLLACLSIGVCARAQSTDKTMQVQAAAQSATQAGEEVPNVPGVTALLRGFNAGVTFSQVHDSSAGWYNLFTPAVSYTISHHFSADASVAIYPDRLIQNHNPATDTVQPLVATHGEVGDTFIGLHGSFNPRFLQSATTATFSVPTGNSSDGLGAGRFTFDVSERAYRSFGRAGLLADFGGGNSSGTFNRVVTRNEDSVGRLLHFQAGFTVDLPLNSRFQSLAYEQLPIGNQTVYSSVSAPGAPPQTVTSGMAASEDNGVTNILSIPVTPHFTLWSYYNRSVHLGIDTASVGLTYVIRGTATKRQFSMIDRALREAEGANR